MLVGNRATLLLGLLTYAGNADVTVSNIASHVFYHDTITLNP